MKRKILFTILLLLVVTAVGFTVYINDYYVATESFETYDNIFETDNYYWIQNKKSTKGFIFYPGGKVESAAYIPFLRKLSNKGYNVFIAKMPFKLAVLKPAAAEEIVTNKDFIEKWLIGGHSLGGVMASRFAQSHPSIIEGLILLGAYPLQELSSDSFRTIAIVGSKDGLLTSEDLNQLKRRLSSRDGLHIIPGGNHSYFGDYGLQKGDGKPSISRQEQQAQTIDLIIDFYKMKKDVQ